MQEKTKDKEEGNEKPQEFREFEKLTETILRAKKPKDAKKAPDSK